MFYKSTHDYLDLGTWDVSCAYCGRKRKANELVRDREFAYGLWACPEHADFKHPQDYARGVKDDMSVPFAQPPVVSFVELNTDFPLSIAPSPLELVMGTLELGADIEGDVVGVGGGNILGAGAVYGADVWAVVPGWVVPVSYAWAWAEGGTGISIDSPTALNTFIQTTNGSASGLLQLTVVDNLGAVGVATVEVTA